MISHFRAKALIALALLSTSAPVVAASTLLKEAEDLYNHNNYEASVALLDRHSKDPATNFLLGRNYYMSGDFKAAVDAFEKAAVAAPASSEYMDWLGKAYGKRAELANPLLAAGLASKARQAFERAVSLDPKNRDALDDLFDFYLEAPGFLGGGYDKAQGVAEKLSAIDPGQGYYDKFKLDQKRKEFGSAEQNLRQAVVLAPHSVSHLVALAKFLANQGRVLESDAAFAKAKNIAPNDPDVWFARADILVHQKRNIDEAKELLQRYLRTPVSADNPPHEAAQRLLKSVGGA